MSKLYPFFEHAPNPKISKFCFYRSIHCFLKNLLTQSLYRGRIHHSKTGDYLIIHYRDFKMLGRRRRLKRDINCSIWEKLRWIDYRIYYCENNCSVCAEVNLKEQLSSLRVHVVLKTLKCPGWRCIQNEDGVEINLHGTENYLFSSFCMRNYFVWRTPSSRFAVVDLKVPIAEWSADKNEDVIQSLYIIQ